MSKTETTTPHLKDYAIVEKLGSGSYATVYKAFRKVGTREVVALKCVEKAKLSSAAVENLVTEISLLKTLKHEYIVEMKDFTWDDRYIYIIMEYCAGGDLSHFIKSRQRLPEGTCKKFLQQLATALKYLRSHNVSHMDLKPQNLLLTSKTNATLKLADFGFAQYLSSQDQKTTLRGSPLYMAPEMLLKHKYDASVDLWSVGVIMYECLFGMAPYSSKTFEELAVKIKTQQEIRLPPQSSVSVECQDLLMRLLQHDPKQRITFDEFFNHPFLDLEHMPTPESLKKAVKLVQAAVQADADKKYKDAWQKYCDSLQYFVPLVKVEIDATKKIALRKKVDDYIRRAEDLKQLIKKEAGSGSSDISGIQDPDSLFDELCRLAAVTANMPSGLNIGHAAEQYMAEGQYSIALEKYEMCLGILLPLLAQEPKGRRRDLLRLQVEQWMSQAETAKLLTADSSDDSKELCRMQ